MGIISGPQNDYKSTMLIIKKWLVIDDLPRGLGTFSNEAKGTGLTPLQQMRFA